MTDTITVSAVEVPEEETPNLARTVGYNPPSYDEYMRWSNRSPMWGGQGNLPVYPGNDYHYTPLSMREAYEDHNIPPVMYNRGGFTGAAFRTYVNPFGQMMVQPLVGAASRYPHVLSGVPMDMNYGFNWAMQDVPMWMPWLWGRGAQPPAPQATPRAASTRQPAAPVARNTGNPSAQQPQPTPGGTYDETVWRNKTMPRSIVAPAPILAQQVAPPAPAVLPYEDDGMNYDFDERVIEPTDPGTVSSWWNSGGLDPNASFAPGGFTAPSTPNLAQQVAPQAPPASAPVPQAAPLPVPKQLQAPSPMQMMFPNGLPQVQMPQPRPQLQVPPLVQVTQESVPQLVGPSIMAPQSVAPTPSALLRIPVR